MSLGGIKHHKPNCQCFCCKAKRGELKLTQETKDKISKANSGEKNGMYRQGYLIIGEKNGMTGRTSDSHPNFIKNPNSKQFLQRCFRDGHKYIIKKKGPAKNYKCVDCGKQALDWSNIDHNYQQDLDTFVPRCRSCHKLYDSKLNNVLKSYAN